jgi:hypothetical protein
MLGGPMMELDVRVPYRGFVETIRERIAELEYREATDAATPDTCEELIDLHEFLDKLYTMSLEHARKTLQ